MGGDALGIGDGALLDTLADEGGGGALFDTMADEVGGGALFNTIAGEVGGGALFDVLIDVDSEVPDIEEDFLLSGPPSSQS